MDGVARGINFKLSSLAPMAFEINYFEVLYFKKAVIKQKPKVNQKKFEKLFYAVLLGKF